MNYETFIDLIRTGKENGKMRFELLRYGNQGGLFYRACQGHSLSHIQDEENLEFLTEANCPNHFDLNEVVYGEYPHFQASIEERGRRT